MPQGVGASGQRVQYQGANQAAKSFHFPGPLETFFLFRLRMRHEAPALVLKKQRNVAIFQREHIVIHKKWKRFLATAGPAGKIHMARVHVFSSQTRSSCGRGEMSNQLSSWRAASPWGSASSQVLPGCLLCFLDIVAPDSDHLESGLDGCWAFGLSFIYPHVGL